MRGVMWTLRACQALASHALRVHSLFRSPDTTWTTAMLLGRGGRCICQRVY